MNLNLFLQTSTASPSLAESYLTAIGHTLNFPQKNKANAHGAKYLKAQMLFEAGELGMGLGTKAIFFPKSCLQAAALYVSTE